MSIHATALVTLMLQLAAPGPAAQVVKVGSPRNEGVIVKIDRREIVVDLGTRDGFRAGQRVRILRRLRVKHPLSGRVLEDRFPIGVLVLEQVGRYLSIIRSFNKLKRPPAVGDFVVRLGGRGARSTTLPAGAGRRPARGGHDPAGLSQQGRHCPKCRKDRQMLALHRAWLSTLGRPVRQRIQIWNRFLKRPSKGRFRVKVIKEIRWLYALSRGSWLPARAMGVRVYHSRPRLIRVKEPVRLTMAVVAPWKIAAVICHVRAGRVGVYAPLRMSRVGDYAWSVRVPPGMIKPKWLQYYIEILSPTGASYLAAGRPRAPHWVRVRKPLSTKPQTRGRSYASTFFEYVTFYASAPQKDYYYRFEADYMYRLRKFLYAVRMGLGIFEGAGGPALGIEDGTVKESPRALSYGYLELEFRLGSYFSIIGRGIMGSLLKDDLGRPGGASGGFEGRIRIGRELGTNLVMGLLLFGDVGTEGVITFTIAKLPRFPIAASLVVTNLPVGEDVGVRLILQGGWRVARWFSFNLRAGVNVRNIRHAGPSVGAGLVFHW